MIALVIIAGVILPLGLVALGWSIGYRAGRRDGVYRATLSDYPATPRQLRRAQRRQKADLSEALRRVR